jgi:Periplasmic copper-binding protein (NosD)
VPDRHHSPRRGARASVLIAVLACALIAFAAIPALAAAETYEVNSTANTGLSSKCVGHVAGECTLRGAILAANLSSTPDVITFEKPLFGGLPGAAELAPEPALPTIAHPVELDASGCSVVPYDKPCVGLTTPAGTAGLTVGSPEVTVKGIAFGGGETGIEVLGGSTGFIATGDWFGLDLSPVANPITNAGIVLGPGADEARIGAATAEAANRNVFTNSKVGVLVEGASKAKILGNYIGVDQEGKVPESVEVGVGIVDAGPGAEAEEDEVGGELTPGQASSLICDGACNVIATESGVAIDLSGERGIGGEAASGPTYIRGNYLGLAADGTSPIGENEYGVFAAPSGLGCGAGPADVMVGGTARTEGNFIEGGQIGLFAEGSENFHAEGNSIGIDATGAESEGPFFAAISLCAETVTERAQVTGNAIAISPDSRGIESDYGAADLVGNSILGSEIGILTLNESEGRGDLIKGNTITKPDVAGMEIGNQSNVVIGNTIEESGKFGIRLVEGAEHNRIGGDGAGEANTINRAGTFEFHEGAAIVIEGEESSRNEIAANTGFGSYGSFIELIGQSGSEIPNGLMPPTISAALQSSAAGTAEADTTVRVFSKAAAELGELGALLAVVKTDSSGVWKATFAKQPVETLVAATQTSKAGTPEAGTSEVSAALAAAADPVEPEKEKEQEGGGSGGGTGGGSQSSSTSQNTTPPPARPTLTAPVVKLIGKPAKSSGATTAKFKFTATPAAGATFECKLDGAKWAKCKSPKTYKKLTPGKHTFRIRATGPTALRSKATVFKFTVQP